GLTMYIRSAGATRLAVVLYQLRLFQLNVLSTATKKPLTILFATVPSASLSRSASVTLSGLPFSSTFCHQGFSGSSSGGAGARMTIDAAAAAAVALSSDPAVSSA